MQARRFVRIAGVGLASAAVVVGLTGCGDDDAPPPPQRPVSATPGPASQPGAVPGGNKNQLVEKLHIEERVSCPIPDKPTDPKGGKCDPKAPSCDEHLYCLQLPQGFFCEPCAERDSIRHTFKDRDFVAGQNRDPFQSFLLPQIPTTGNTLVQIDPTKKCLRDDQMVATTYSYSELKLVGIVALGTQRKVLMIVGREGYIIKRGDCVGKEKAVVKDIGTSYITFQIDPDPTSASQRAAQEYSIQLNPKQLAVNVPSELPSAAPKTTITPVVPPRAVVPPRPGQTGSGAGPGSAAPPPVEAPPSAPKKS